MFTCVCLSVRVSVCPNNIYVNILAVFCEILYRSCMYLEISAQLDHLIVVCLMFFDGLIE